MVANKLPHQEIIEGHSKLTDKLLAGFLIALIILITVFAFYSLRNTNAGCIPQIMECKTISKNDIAPLCFTPKCILIQITILTITLSIVLILFSKYRNNELSGD
jgi:uncharacterized membrane protein